MKTSWLSPIFLLLPLLSGLTHANDATQTTEAEPPAAAAHVQRALQIAGSDLKFLADGLLCEPAENQIPYAIKNVPGFLDPKAPGAVVISVQPDGAASRAGLQADDMLLEAGGEPIQSLADLRRRFETPGEHALKIWRKGEELTLRVRR